MNSPTVFISYSHKDKEWVNEWLLPRLEQNGLKVIIDYRDFEIGVASLINMGRAIENSDKTILVLTPDWVDSEWANFESLVLQSSDPTGLKGSIIPLMLKECQLPPHIRILTYADFKERDNWDNELSRLIGQIAEKPAADELPAIDVMISLAKLPPTNPELFGREKELEILDKAWADQNTNIVSLVAFGGVGKTALVSVWLRQLAEDNWRGAEKVLGWSFYSQGAAEGRQVSADQFIAFALEWFGDDDPTKGSPWDKGERLAEYIKRQRTLLILDGLEPLQDSSPGRLGCINDPGLQTMLRELAVDNLGLCIVTTRLDVDDLKDYAESLVQPVPLEHLNPEAGAQLLEHLGAKGTPEELEQASREFEGHALALTLMGRLVAKRYGGDVRQRDKIPKLTKEKKQGRHARRVMESYEKWFKGKPELDILRMMGLFDRPAPGGAIAALRAKPAIKGLTTKTQKLSDEDWLDALDNLREVRLISPEDRFDPDTLDCHPLVREHFGKKLEKDNPEAWKEAHSRLYDYLRHTAEHLPDTVEEMAPLFAAVAHGCQAGRHREAFEDVLRERIDRHAEAYAFKKLGAIGLQLAAISAFFEIRWHQPAVELEAKDKLFVLHAAGFFLGALGRLEEAQKALEASLRGCLELEDWKNAARGAMNLSELFLIMGVLDQAFKYSRDSVIYADRSGVDFEQIVTRTNVGNILHQLGRIAEAETEFTNVEEMQEKWQQEFPFLYSQGGVKYCDLLLAEGKNGKVIHRVGQTLKWAIENKMSLATIALDHLSLGRARLQQAVIEEQNDIAEAANHLNQAVGGLRQAGIREFISIGLLVRAELYRMQREFEKAERDVDEAMTIVTRGGMRLYEADCQLEYARLYLAMGEKEMARESLETAVGMIEEMGYHRRDPEVHLVYAKLFVAEGDQDKAREHLNTAKKMIEKMGMHRWDREAEDLAEVLG